MGGHDREPLPELESDLQFENLPIRERAWELLVTLREPTDVETISNQLECSSDAARSHFRFFDRLDIVTKHSGTPERFERNEEYFEWRYVTHLAAENSIDELHETITDLLQRRSSFQQFYDADNPSEASYQNVVDLDIEISSTLTEHLGGDEASSDEEMWDDLATWANIDDEIRFHQRAIRRLLERGESMGESERMA